jgi:AcrR family transcriptional regulator
MQNPGRPREFDPDETLAKIMNLFWAQGYEATGLSDIIAATGLGKASLYATFGNKQSMYLKALAHYEALAVDAAVTLLWDTRYAPLERIDMFLTSPIVAVRDQNDRRGCFLCNASADRASMDEETGALVRRGYEKMRVAIAHALAQEAPDAGAAPIAARAQLVLTVYSGLRVMARSGLTSDALSLAKEQALAAVSVPCA